MEVHFEAARMRRSNLTQKGGSMKMIESIKSWIGALTDVGLMLLALAIVAALLVGGNLPFFGTVVGNIVALIKDLGANGLVGLIALGLIVWLFSNRSLA
jgi:ABC-type enterochelin transport system permease subunit